MSRYEFTIRPIRTATLSATVGMLAIVLCTFSAPIFAATNSPVAPTSTKQVAGQTATMPWDVIVASLAGLAMFGAACGVLFYVARTRHVPR